MRILLLCPDVLSSVGGVAQYTRMLGENFKALGEEVHILTDAGQRVSENDKDWIHPLVEKWEGDALADILLNHQNLKPDWAVMQYVPQLYHKAGIAFQAANIPAILKKRAGCKTAVTFHEFFSAWGVSPRSIFFALMTRFLTSRLLAGSDKAVTTCPRYENDLRKTFPSRPVLMAPVGSNIKPCPLKADDRERLISKYGLHGYKVFSVLGVMSPRRNYEIGLDILKLVLKRELKFKMMLIGNMGASQSAVVRNFKARAEELKVQHFLIETGHLSAEEVSWHMQLTDVMIFPQIDGISTRSTALMSSLEHGCCIAAYRPVKGNFLQTLPPGIEFADSRGPADFIEKTVRMLAVSGHRDSSENREFFQKHFSANVISQSYLKFLKDLN